MSLLGQSLHIHDVCATSALPPIATVIMDVFSVAPSLSTQQLRQLGEVRRHAPAGPRPWSVNKNTALNQDGGLPVRAVSIYFPYC